MKTSAIVMLFAAAAAAQTFDVRAHGAKGDGVTLDSPAIQKAIDAAFSAGGGVVVLPAGNYLSGTLVLKSNVSLRLYPGATLWASKRAEDYNPRRLIYAVDAENIAVEGQGTINGNGDTWWDKQTGRRSYKAMPGRPSPLLEFVNSRNVRVQDVSIRQAPGWAIHPLECDGVLIRGIRIIADPRGPNTDGIDPDSSRNVLIADSFIDTGDDAIVIKTTGQRGGKILPSENITITNCVLTTRCNAFKMGTESRGDFRNISVTNCAIYGKPDTVQRPISGIAVEMVDGAVTDGVVVSNITMRDVDTPIFIRLGNRGRGQAVPTTGSLRNVSINNVIAAGGTMSSSVTGLPGHRVQNVSLTGINITMKGGEQEVRGLLDVPEQEDKYPEARMFGKLPSHGFFVRHVEGLTMRSLQLRTEEPDVRPAMIFHDVRELDLDGFRADSVHGKEAVLWFHDVVGAMVRGARTPHAVQDFLRVTGAASRSIQLSNNQVAPAGRMVRIGEDVGDGAVIE
ncbi:MAG TPA: glycoside hydrolase family 28 protein [Bryobacteraceae bacterium]|nr:glycoside hydrolase family 28 protein [Bryobacteraceae bacterium]